MVISSGPPMSISMVGVSTSAGRFLTEPGLYMTSRRRRLGLDVEEAAVDPSERLRGRKESDEELEEEVGAFEDRGVGAYEEDKGVVETGVGGVGLLTMIGVVLSLSVG